MRVCAFQPKYPYKSGEMEQLAEWLESSLDGCDESLDLIVLPEACNAMSQQRKNRILLLYAPYSGASAWICWKLK